MLRFWKKIHRYNKVYTATDKTVSVHNSNVSGLASSIDEAKAIVENMYGLHTD